MKKIFMFNYEKIKYFCMVDVVKYEVKKYLKCECNKIFLVGVDYWVFDCKFGELVDEVEVVYVVEINKCISDIEVKGLILFYVEILVCFV